MQTLTIEKLREDTPATAQLIHFNNAGASLPPRPVVNAIKDHLDCEALMGGYEAAHFAAHKIDNFYAAAARFINCTPEEIAFTENATRAWDMAFYSLKFAPKDKIITSAAEYASNFLAFLQIKKRYGIEIKVVKNDNFGQLDIHDLEDKIDKDVKLIAITHIPTQGGLINPAIQVGEIAKKYNITFLLDSTQSIGQMPIDVEEIGCDFLCATGRKYLRGPRGTGFLYARKNKISELEPPFIDLKAARWMADEEYMLASTAARFESWEQNIAAKIGLGVAIDYAQKLGMSAIWERIQQLSKLMRSHLQTIPALSMHDLGENKCGIISFTIKDKSPQEIQKYLAQKNINVSISLEEYARLDLHQRKLPAIIRASLHYYNTEEEIDQFVTMLTQLASSR